MDVKPKTRFSFLDFILLLLAALLIVGGIWFVGREQEKTTIELDCTMTFFGTAQDYVGCFSTGKEVYTADGTPLGTVTRSWGIASETRTFDRTPKDDGEYSYSGTRSGEKRDQTVVIRIIAEKKENGFYVGETRIAAGLDLSVLMAGYTGTGSIRNVSEVKTNDGE